MDDKEIGTCLSFAIVSSARIEKRAEKRVEGKRRRDHRADFYGRIGGFHEIIKSANFLP